jgi:isocitrate lyase
VSSADPIPSHPDEHRWEGIERPYDAEDVERLRGSVPVEHTLARRGAEKLWRLLKDRPYVATRPSSRCARGLRRST